MTKRAARAIDRRLGTSRAARSAVDKVFPDHWSFLLGELALYALIVLVLTVSRFIDLLAAETNPTRLTISPRAVFTFGSAVLIAVSFVLGAWTSQSMEGVAREDGADQVLLFVVDILKEEATLLVPNALVKEMAEKSFGATVTGDTVVLPGIMSRKKQIIPALTL